MMTTRGAPDLLGEPDHDSIGRLRAVGEIVGVIFAFLLTATLLGPVLGVPLAALALYGGVVAAWVYSGTIGLLMFFVYWARDRNLWAPILAHGLMDSVAVTLLYLGVW